VEGDFEDKYHSKNPISRYLVRGFIDAFKAALLDAGKPKKIAEFGVGHGYISRILAQVFSDAEIQSCDISQDIAQIAQNNLAGTSVKVDVQDVENLPYTANSFDLVVCCEILEHVNNPKRALGEIYRVANGRLICSVPNEPLWRVLNVMRGSYIGALGNTPGHLNHWSPTAFVDAVASSGFNIVEVKNPLPWTMVLADKHSAS
jgi:ubiquinone/menaquinone biosynthesis C-methylase UbiE